MQTFAVIDRDAQDKAASALATAFATTDPADPDRAVLRGRVIEAWLPLAQHLTRRYTGRGEPADDLFQVAVLGLIKAVDRYDPEHGMDFAVFAIPTVLGEIKRYFRDRTWSVRVPRRLQELRLAITAANGELTQVLGRAATVADIAAHLKITEEEVLEGLEGGRAYTAASLSTPVNDTSGVELGETLGTLDAGFELTENLVSLRPALAKLDERERAIVALRFSGELSQSEIGEQLGISQMHVSRLLAKALATLRAQLLGRSAGPANAPHTRATGR